MSGYLITPDGRRWVPFVPTGSAGLPDPVQNMPEGMRFGPDSQGMIGRVWNDLHNLGESRTKTEKINLQETNMVERGYEVVWKDGKVKVTDGPATVLVAGTGWYELMRREQGDGVLGKFDHDGYGAIPGQPSFMDGAERGNCTV